MTLSRETVLHRETTIIKMRKLGCTTNDIADYLQINPGQVQNIATQLLTKGKTQRMHKNSGRNRGSRWENMEYPKTRQLIDLFKAGKSLTKIGKTMKLTRERIRQIIDIIEKKHGSEVLGILPNTYQTDEVTKILHISLPTLYRLLKQISCKQQGIRWKVTPADMKKLRELLEKICPNCSNNFLGVKKFCCRACYRQYYDRKAYPHRKKWVRNLPNSLNNWYGKTYRSMSLQTVVNGKKEQWLRSGQACQAAGISYVQLQCLKISGIIKTKNDPDRFSRNGKPQKLYAASQIEVVRQIYMEWKQKN